ncbi:hypothetical protein IDH44_13325 [Paenibacillus sp. IB182496]|uniref:Uncharacterized protein n=1 Tax=Paenibacillus sabuli TaxID=2772509 RepID=A0A927GSD8_9BACL|nr:hypothetical protein [Paenibacillus sabuli]MBD2846181.1 hypothetical protein [Paenibacillus sabuli]
MVKTDWTMNDAVKPEDMNQIGQEINAKTVTVLSATPPENPTLNTIWYEDLGENPDLGGGGLVIANASTDGDEEIWLEEI